MAFTRHQAAVGLKSMRGKCENIEVCFTSVEPYHSFTTFQNIKGTFLLNGVNIFDSSDHSKHLNGHSDATTAICESNSLIPKRIENQLSPTRAKMKLRRLSNKVSNVDKQVNGTSSQVSNASKFTVLPSEAPLDDTETDKMEDYFNKLLKLARIESITAEMIFTAKVFYVKSPTDIYAIPTEYLDYGALDILEKYLKMYIRSHQMKNVNFFENESLYIAKLPSSPREYSRVYLVSLFNVFTDLTVCSARYSQT